jgi:hypothetical protein
VLSRELPPHFETVLNCPYNEDTHSLQCFLDDVFVEPMLFSCIDSNAVRVTEKPPQRIGLETRRT